MAYFLGGVLFRLGLRLRGTDPRECVVVRSRTFREWPKLVRFVRDVESLPFNPDDLSVTVTYRGRTDDRLEKELSRADR